MKNLKETKTNYFKELDQKQKTLGNELVKLLEEKYYKVEIAYINYTQNTTDRGIEIYVYSNDYDYRKISLKFIEDVSVREYFHTVLSCINKKECKLHIASAEEIYIHNLIKEYDSIFYIIDGMLMCEGEELIDLDNIVSIAKDEYRLIIVDDCCRCIFDLESDTYTCEDIEDNGDITNKSETSKLILNKELKKYITDVNVKPLSKIIYKITDGKLSEYNIKTKMETELFNISDIVDYGLSEDGDMWLKLKDENDIYYLSDYGFTM